MVPDWPLGPAEQFRLEKTKKGTVTYSVAFPGKTLYLGNLHLLHMNGSLKQRLNLSENVV
jgi:hypothetical protein